MASVAVFVDDAVRGTLPGVCVKDGVPTESGLTLREELGDRAGLGVAWLLLLAGPFGWLGLLLIAASRGGRREILTVQVPMCDPDYQRLRHARRAQNLSMGIAVAAVSVVLLTLLIASSDVLQRAGVLVGGVVAIGAVVSVVLNEARAQRARVGVDLDASRRWVTLTGVHPDFAAACQAHEQRQGQRT